MIATLTAVQRNLAEQQCSICTYRLTIHLFWIVSVAFVTFIVDGVLWTGYTSEFD